jgi:hypothetical protein
MRVIRFVRHQSIALLALFIALGGSSYAALRIHGSQIENRSVSGKKLKRNTLGGATIRESRLGKVRRARRADRLGSFTPRSLRMHCPPGMPPVSGVCAETATRAPAAYGVARIECDAAGRRLPTYEELATFVSSPSYALTPPGELTSNVYMEGAALRIVTVNSEGGGASSVGETGTQARPFRCVAYPSN